MRRLSILVLALAGGCAGEDPPLETGEASGLSVPFDLGSVMSKVHFAFREEQGALVAEHATYAVRVGEDRKIAIRAKQEARATLALETIAIRRGAGAGAMEAGAARVAEDGSLSIRRGLAEERLVNGEDGVEQSWLFAEPPAGEGALEIRVRAGGLAYAGETAAGHHFVDPSTGLGLRYGLATWIDFRGARSSIAVAREGDDLVMRVPAELVEDTTFPAVLDPLVSPELGSDQTLRASLAAEDPRIACGEGVCLVAWIDRRHGVASLFAARIDEAGQLLDPAGIRVSAPFRTTTHADVVWTGRSFLLTYWQTELGFQLYAASIARDGTRSASAVAVPPAYLLQGSTLAWGRDRALIAWADIDNNVSVGRFAIIDQLGGVVVGRSDLAPVAVFDVASAWNGNFFVGTAVVPDGGGGQGLFSVSIDPATGLGLSRALLGLPIAATISLGGVACDGETCVLTYSDDLVGLRALHIDAAASAAEVFDLDPAHPTRANDIAFDGTRYRTTFSRIAPGFENDIYSLALDRTGAPIGAPVAHTSGSLYEDRSVLANTGDGLLLAWRSAPGPITARRISRGGVDLSNDLVVSGTVINSQSSPSVACDGSNFLLVWDDDRGGASSREILGARITPAGRLLDRHGIGIASGPGVRRKPSVAFGGGFFLVAWEGETSLDNSDIFGARVTTDGFVIDTPAISIATDAGHQSKPRVTSNGTRFVVVYETRTGVDADLALAGVTAAGVIDVGMLLQTTPGVDETDPAIAYDATTNRYFLFWTDWSAGAESSPDILGRSYDANTLGSVHDFVLAVGPNAQEHASVASDAAGNVLVVWQELTGFDTDVRAARVAASSGLVLDRDGVAIASGPGDQLAPAVVLRNSRMIVAYTDTNLDRGGDVRASLVRKTNLEVTGLIEISTTADPESGVAVACTSLSHCLAGYEGYVSAWSKDRVRGRAMTP